MGKNLNSITFNLSLAGSGTWYWGLQMNQTFRRYSLDDICGNNLLPNKTLSGNRKKYHNIVIFWALP